MAGSLIERESIEIIESIASRLLGLELDPFSAWL